MGERYLRITSSSNLIIKELRELSEKKGRSRHGAFAVEGVKLVTEALENNIAVRYFVVAESFLQRFESMPPVSGNPTVYLVPDDLLGRVSNTESPQGIIAVSDLPKLRNNAESFSRCVILENLQDPGNVGTIIRTADACGFEAVLLSSGCADPYSPKVLRSAMGSVFHLPVINCEDIYEMVLDLKRTGIRVAAAHPRDSAAVWDSPLAGGVAIVIGNEGNGLTERMLELADFHVMIPMPGKAESFNAAAAASILLYESMRQKNSAT